MSPKPPVQQGPRTVHDTALMLDWGKVEWAPTRLKTRMTDLRPAEQRRALRDLRALLRAGRPLEAYCAEQLQRTVTPKELGKALIEHRTLEQAEALWQLAQALTEFARRAGGPEAHLRELAGRPVAWRARLDTLCATIPYLSHQSTIWGAWAYTPSQFQTEIDRLHPQLELSSSSSSILRTAAGELPRALPAEQLYLPARLIARQLNQESRATLRALNAGRQWRLPLSERTAGSYALDWVLRGLTLGRQHQPAWRYGQYAQATVAQPQADHHRADDS